MELHSWESLKKIAINEKISLRLVTGERAMVARISLAKGAVVPRHQHESEQLSYIVEGALKFQVEGREVTVHEGEVLLVPSNVPHGAVALEDTLNLEIFSPPRPDWLARLKE